MSTRNRERRERNREARLAAEEAAQRRARRQRWALAVGGLVVAAAVAIVLLVDPFGDDDGDDVTAAPPSTTVAPATTTPVAPAECVAVSEALPEGAPDVPVKVGPAPTELVIEDLVVGEGEEITADSNPSINYIGVACSTGAVFDDSYSTGTPFQPDSVPESPGWEVIEGWQQGIPGMKVGGRRLLGIPPDLAYGAESPSPDIAPNETLWFVVEAVSV